MFQLIDRTQPFSLPGYPDFLAALLHARGISTQEEAELFLNPSLEQISDPASMQGMNKAVEVINHAVKGGQRVVVYGDYDADGICATSILLSALKRLGADAFSYIPDRQQEGYGLNPEAIALLSKQASLLISVDCGITAVEETDLAKELGMQVVLTDHHALPDALPQADALVHPQLGDYQNPLLCGAGVAFQLARALCKQMVSDWLVLAALATVADMVPLVGENRALVALGLAAMADTNLVGLHALMNSSGIQAGVPLTAQQVAFQLAPRLNAGGRLSTAQDALQLLLTNSEKEAQELAQRLETLNQERRQVAAQVQKEAMAQVDALDLSQLRSLVVAGKGWNTGVVGLAAGKLAEQFNYPSVVLSEKEGEYTGSGRSVEGVDLHLALSQCSDLFLRFGGHKMAAGLTLKKEHLAVFIKRFDQAVRDQLKDKDLVPLIQHDGCLPLDQAHQGTIDLLRKMAPFGLGNPSPTFLFEGLGIVSARQMGRENDHLKIRVSGQGKELDAVAFSKGARMSSLPTDIRLVGSVEENHFQGRTSVQIMVKHILPGDIALPDRMSLTAKSLLRNLQNASGFQGGPEAQPILELPKLSGFRGTLLVAHTEQGANALYQAFPHLNVFTQKVDDKRGFHAIVAAPDWSMPYARFDTLVFADGVVSKQEAAQAMKACQAQTAWQMPQSEGLQTMLKNLVPSKDDLRKAYVNLRSGLPLPFEIGKNQACLMVLAELDLIKLDENLDFSAMIPMEPCEPEQSPLFLTLQAM